MRKPRFECPECGRKYKRDLIPIKAKICFRCNKRTKPISFTLSKIPEKYFEQETIRVDG